MLFFRKCERTRSIGLWILSWFKTNEVIIVRKVHGLGWNHPDYTGNDRKYEVYQFFGVRLVFASAARDAANSVGHCFEWFEKFGVRGNGTRTNMFLKHAKALENAQMAKAEEF